MFAVVRNYGEFGVNVFLYETEELAQQHVRELLLEDTYDLDAEYEETGKTSAELIEEALVADDLDTAMGYFNTYAHRDNIESIEYQEIEFSKETPDKGKYLEWLKTKQ